MIVHKYVQPVHESLEIHLHVMIPDKLWEYT